MTRRSLAAAWIILAAFGGCAATDAALAESELYFQRADYYQAYWILANARREHPDDPAIEKRYWEVRTAYLLKRGQNSVFADQELDAIADFEQVLVWDPGNRIAETWLRKARDKLAIREAREGDRLRSGGDLEGAVKAYHTSLTHKPGNAEAEAGLRELAELWRKRRSKAQDHYVDGVRALAEQLFNQTRYHMLIALDSDPTLEGAESQAAKAARRLAERRFAAARTMEDRGFYEPALLEYRAIAASHPDYPGIDERIAHMEKEAEAKQLVRDGEMEVFRGNYPVARQLLERAFDLSASQRAKIGEKLVLVQERELESRYRGAKDLELQHKYEDAIAAYRAIDESMPGFLDIRTRIGQLEFSIVEAERAFAAGQQAEQAGDPAKAIGHYTDALLFYPGYKGLDARIRELRGTNDG